MIHIFSTYTEDWKPLIDVVGPLWFEYAERHGYQLQPEVVEPEFPEHYSFTKTAAVLRKAEAVPHGDSIFVIDLDMIPTNMTYDLDMTLIRCAKGGAGTLSMGKDINGWNSGAYFVSGHPLNLSWLRTIVGLRSVCTSEQHAMWLINEAFGVGETKTINSIPYHEYEGFEFQTKDHHSQWQPGHFTCHLPGMTMEQRIELLASYSNQIIR